MKLSDPADWRACKCTIVGRSCYRTQLVTDTSVVSRKKKYYLFSIHHNFILQSKPSLSRYLSS